VGSRFYTYIWTMYQCMVAAAAVRARFVVLDRPNPTGGQARGPMMTRGFTSFVGLREIVQQHGMTVGELARFFDGEFLAKEGGRVRELSVIEVEGWRPDVRYADTGLPWVMPSPNIGPAVGGPSIPLGVRGLKDWRSRCPYAPPRATSPGSRAPRTPPPPRWICRSY
jgi:uncharacterized protein YbbC (DUF1343 family)